MVYYHDIFIDIPANPSVLTPLYNDGEDFVDTVKSYLESFHISCERYSIVKPSGKVRHSTIDVKDAVANGTHDSCKSSTIVAGNERKSVERPEEKIIEKTTQEKKPMTLEEMLRAMKRLNSFSR